MQFYTDFWCGIGVARAYLHFTAKMYNVTLRVEMYEKFGIPDEEKTFSGENAIEEIVVWAVDVLYELYQTIEARTSPYANGHESYLRAIRGEEI